MRKSLSDKGVQALKPRATRYNFPDPELRGHYVRVQPSGSKSFAAVAVNPQGKQIWTAIGRADAMPIEEARRKARDVLTRVREGLPAVEPRADTFEAVAEQWRERYVEKNALRSADKIRGLLRLHVYPKWKDREFLSIRRSDVAALLDHVEDHHSARQADAVLTVLRSLMNWQAIRLDDYSPPIVRKMRRSKLIGRERILNDEELGLIWQAAEDGGQFGAIVRVCLLTAQRRAKVTTMRWADVSEGVWTIATASREKGNAGALPLPEAALAIIAAQPRVNEFVFAGRWDGPVIGISGLKDAFDAKLPPLPRWTLHDLRRTARSLMSRAEVRSEIAERVMGHAIGGVEGIYDRHCIGRRRPTRSGDWRHQSRASSTRARALCRCEGGRRMTEWVDIIVVVKELARRTLLSPMEAGGWLQTGLIDSRIKTRARLSIGRGLPAPVDPQDIRWNYAHLENGEWHDIPSEFWKHISVDWNQDLGSDNTLGFFLGPSAGFDDCELEDTFVVDAAEAWRADALKFILDLEKSGGELDTSIKGVNWRRGRPPKYDWPAFYRHLQRFCAEHKPKERRLLTQQAKRYFRELNQSPDKRELGRHITKVWQCYGRA